MERFLEKSMSQAVIPVNEIYNIEKKPACQFEEKQTEENTLKCPL